MGVFPAPGDHRAGCCSQSPREGRPSTIARLSLVGDASGAGAASWGAAHPDAEQKCTPFTDTETLLPTRPPGGACVCFHHNTGADRHLPQEARGAACSPPGRLMVPSEASCLPSDTHFHNSSCSRRQNSTDSKERKRSCCSSFFLSVGPYVGWGGVRTIETIFWCVYVPTSNH